MGPSAFGNVVGAVVRDGSDAMTSLTVLPVCEAGVQGQRSMGEGGAHSKLSMGGAVVLSDASAASGQHDSSAW